jgi:hypothetical protein
MLAHDVPGEPLPRSLNVAAFDAVPRRRRASLESEELSAVA